MSRGSERYLSGAKPSSKPWVSLFRGMVQDEVTGDE